jgi:hypothetical protein
MKNKWFYLQDKDPYFSIEDLGIALGHSIILNYPALSNLPDIRDYEYLTEGNENIDAIVVYGLGAIINRKQLEHTKKEIERMLNFEE